MAFQKFRVQLNELNLSQTLTKMRRKLAFSQEDLARQLGVSFATVNRWENGHSKPSKLAFAQLNSFCERMIEQGKLDLNDEVPS